MINPRQLMNPKNDPPLWMILLAMTLMLVSWVVLLLW